MNHYKVQSKKSQASLDFFILSAWVIGITILVVGIASYYGVFDVLTTQNNECDIYDSFDCLDIRLNEENKVEIALRTKLSQTVVINKLVLESTDEGINATFQYLPSLENPCKKYTIIPGKFIQDLNEEECSKHIISGVSYGFKISSSDQINIELYPINYNNEKTIHGKISIDYFFQESDPIFQENIRTAIGTFVITR